MKKLFALLIVLTGLALTGCGLTNATYAERQRRYKNITNYHARMISDDFDYIWLAERPSYLTYWYLREAD